MAKPVKATSGQIPEVRKRKRPTLSISEEADKSVRIYLDGDYSRITNEANGDAVAMGLIGQIVSLGSHRKRVDEDAANFAIDFIDAMKPKDAMEALLLAQMAATHQATMMLARRLNLVENIPQQDAAERALNKTARTFAAQVDTLKRYRSKGHQTVRVERVTVESGGQAVVGNVERGGAGREEK